MAEQIVIAELQINTKALQDSSTKLIQEIAKLKQEQKDLQKETNGLQTATEEQSRAFIENDARLRALNTEYSNNRRVLSETTSGVAGLNEMLAKEATTVGEAEKANKKLSIIRSQITTDTQEGRDAIEEINTRIDSNTNFIRENADAQKKQAMNIGNYQSALEGADAILAKFGINGQQARNTIEGFRSTVSTGAQAINDISDKVGNATRNVIGFRNASTLAAETQIAQTATTATQAATTETLAGSQLASAAATNVSTLSLRGFAVALAATGIGLIVLAVVALTSYLSKLDPVMDKIEQITSGVGAAFDRFGKAIANLDFSNLIGGMEDAYDAAAKLKEAQQALADLQSSQEVANAKASQQYDELILKSKNRTLTEKERLDFLEQAKVIEEANYKQRSNLANAELKQAIEAAKIKGELSTQELENLNRNTIAYANYLLQSGKITQAEYDGIKKAELGKIEIKKESTKLLEKNQNAQDKLEDDRIAKQEKANENAKKAQADAVQKDKEAKDKKVEIMNEELSLFIAKENLKSKTLEQSILFEDTVSKKRIAILEKEYEFGKISKAKYDEELIKITQETALRQSDLMLNQSKAELDLFISQNVTKLDSTKLLSQALIDEESKRLESIKLEKLKQLELDKNTNQVLIDNKIANHERLTIGEIEFLTNKHNLETEFRNQNKANQDAFDEQVKQQKAEQLIADREIELANAQTQLEEDNIIAQQQYDSELAALNEKLKKESITKEQYRKLEIQANKKKDDLLFAAQLKNTQGTLAGLQQLGGGLEALFGKSKALALAMAGINGAQAITSILAQYPKFDGGFAMTAALVAAGTTTIAQVAKITNTKFEKGGLQQIGGNRHSAGGTKFVGEDGTRFEAEQGELIGVMNRNASRAFMDFNNSYPSGASISNPNVFASGGFVNQNFSSSNNSVIDYDLLAVKISQANMSLPKPIIYTAIEDINYGQKDYAQVVSGANH